MQERLKGYLSKITDKWKSLERNQQIRLVVTVVVLLITIAATAWITTRPKMIVLKSGLSYEEIAQIQAALTEASIPSNTINNSTAIEVEEKNKDKANVELTVRNVPKIDGYTFEDALKNSGMGTTESVKTESFRRAFESDLGKQLTLFDGVLSAKVSLSLPPKDNYFVKSQSKAKGSAFLELEHEISTSQATGMARFISRAVEGLEMENIEILDQNMNTIYSGMKSISDSNANEYTLELERKQELESKFRNILAPMFDEVRPVVKVAVDWDRTQTKSKTFTPTVPDSSAGLLTEQVKENQSVTNGSADAQPGLNANDQSSSEYEMGQQDNSTATVKNSTSKFAINEQEQVTEASVGVVDYKDSSAAALVFRYVLHDQKYLMDNKKLEGTTWEQYKIDNSVQTPITIDDAIVNAAKIGLGIDNLVITGFSVPVFKDMEVEPINIEQIIMFAILALLILLLAFGLIRTTQADEVTEVEPELSVEDLIVSTQIEEEKEEIMSADRLRSINFESESETKRHIEKFINDKPEAVAQLLRNWLNDEWE